MTDQQPRRFHLQRNHDVIGATGTGRVADGVLWPDGTTTLRWRGDRVDEGEDLLLHASTVHWDNIADAEAIHGHGGHTRIVWDDPEPIGWDNADQTCPHCDPAHTPPGHGQPWGAYVGPERDGDGQPITIHVARAAGAHVAESDAQWIRARLNGEAL